MDIPPLDKLRIVKYPDPVLKATSAEITAFGPDVRALANRMLELMRGADGVGLAAPQVGVNLRLFVCNPTGEPGDELVCVNPVLSEFEGVDEGAEGCLSIPGVSVMMRRALALRLAAKDPEGQGFALEAEGLVARIMQHEVDHLDGRLIIDRMSETDAIANRRAIKQLKEDYAAAQS